MARLVLLPRVLRRAGSNVDAGKPDLVAVIHGRRAAQRHQQHRRNPRLGLSDASGDARPVVIAEHPVRPAAGRQQALVIRDGLGDGARIPRGLEKLEIERKLRAFQLGSVIGDEAFERQVDLADQHALVEFVEHRPHLGDDLVHLGPV